MKSAHEELGERAARELEMENTGTQNRRVWWIKSAAMTALLNTEVAA